MTLFISLLNAEIVLCNYRGGRKYSTKSHQMLFEEMFATYVSISWVEIINWIPYLQPLFMLDRCYILKIAKCK